MAAAQIPLRPQRKRATPRNWAREPEERMLGNLKYRTRYGQGIPPPQSSMLRNLRAQMEFRRTGSEVV